MSRRAVIGILILLIIGVLGGTIALIVSRFSTKQPPVTQTPQTSALPGSNTGGQQIVDPTGDSDADGLTNADEKLWGTNPNNIDTDGDGFKDGEEVQSNHNPTIPSPNDKLPTGFVPGQNIAPLEGSATSPTSFESFFADNVDLTGGKTNLTQEYGKSVPDKDKTALTFNNFIYSQPLTTSLPRINDSLIIRAGDSSAELSQYLSVAGNLDQISDKTDFSLALTDVFESKNASGFQVLSDRAKAFEESIKALPTPPQALEYHKLIIGYSSLLTATFQQISNYPNDQVRALVAIRQVDAIDRQYYHIILNERARLVGLLEP